MTKCYGGAAKMLAASAVLVVAGASSAQAGYVIENFDGMTAGAQPTSTTYSVKNLPSPNTATGVVQVVDSATSPVDPFGGAGNKSLSLSNTATTGSIYTFIGAPVTDMTGANSGTLSFDIVANRTGTATGAFTRVFVGNDTGGGAGGAQNLSLTDGLTGESMFELGFRGDGRIAVYNAAFPGGTSSLDTWTLGQKLHIVVTFDGGTGTGGTFSINVTDALGNTKALRTNTSANPFTSWATINSAVTTARSVQFYDYAISGNTESHAFVDNISLVPEPGTVSLALMAASGLMLARRRAR